LNPSSAFDGEGIRRNRRQRALNYGTLNSGSRNWEGGAGTLTAESRLAAEEATRDAWRYVRDFLITQEVDIPPSRTISGNSFYSLVSLAAGLLCRNVAADSRADRSDPQVERAAIAVADREVMISEMKMLEAGADIPEMGVEVLPEQQED
jgi:hypothetical protein